MAHGGEHGGLGEAECAWVVLMMGPGSGWVGGQRGGRRNIHVEDYAIQPLSIIPLLLRIQGLEFPLLARSWRSLRLVGRRHRGSEYRYSLDLWCCNSRRNRCRSLDQRVLRQRGGAEDRLRDGGRWLWGRREGFLGEGAPEGRDVKGPLLTDSTQSRERFRDS